MLDDKSMARGFGEENEVRTSFRRDRWQPSEHTIQTYITNKEDLDLAMQRVHLAPVVGLDIETSGHKGMGVHNGSPRLIQLGIPRKGGAPAENILIDCFAIDPKKELSRFLSDSRSLKLIHDARFELRWFLYHHGIRVTPLYDTRIASKIIQDKLATLIPEYARRPDTLASLCNWILRYDMSKGEQAGWWGRPHLTDEQLKYAALDVEVLPHIYRRLTRIANELGVSRQIMQASEAMYTPIERSVRNIEHKDDSNVVRVALEASETLHELDAVWLSTRSLAIEHKHTPALLKIYTARRQQLAGPNGNPI